MSRIGKVPIKLPKGVKAKLGPEPSVTITGPKGERQIGPMKRVSLAQEGETLTLKRDSDELFDKACHGLYHRMITNAIKGVTDGYTKELDLVGVGYKAEVKGKVLVLTCGYTHDIKHPAPAGITITCLNPTRVVITGVDKQMVGEQAAKIRSYAPPEPYKGKGIRHVGENVRRKVGKTGAK